MVGYDSVVLFWLPPPSLLSVAPFVIDGSVGALDPREGSLQQGVLLYVRYGLKGSLYVLLIRALQYHCMISELCPPSQLRLTSRPPVTAWSCGSSDIAGRTGCPHSRCQFRLVFALKSHSLRANERQCPHLKAAS